MALTRHRRMRANPVELLVVNPGRPGMSMRHNPEWARSVGRGLYRGSRYAAESARDLYHGAREAHRAHRAAAGASAPTMNPGKKKPKKKRKATVALPKRDSHGKFIKRRLKSNPKKKAKKKAKKAAKKASPVRRRRKKRAAKRRVVVARIAVKANPAKKRRRRRRKARTVRGKRATVVVMANPRRRRRNPLSKRFRAKAKRAVAVIRRRRRRAPAKSLRRRALSAQLRRASAISALAGSRASAKRIRPAIRGLQKAMLTRNPSLQGMLAAAKALAVPAAVTTASLVGMSYLGKMAADYFTTKDGASSADYVKDGKLTATAKYAPAAATAGLSILAWFALRNTTRHSNTLLLGGLSGAMLQALMASDAPVAPMPKDASTIDKVKSAFAIAVSATPTAPAAPAPPAAAAPAAAGFGEYTTVGSGIFHGFGEYTTVGAGGDNRTEFAADSLRGLDDASHFAPGEGGVLSGGIFK